MPTLRKLIEQSETLAEQNEKMRKAFSGMDVANQISQALEEQRRAILQTANTAAQGFYSMDQALRASLRWQADEEQMRSAMLAMKAAADMPARMISPFDIPAAFEVVNPFALADASLRQQFIDMFAIQPPDMGRILGGISEANLQAAIEGVAMPAGWDMMLSGIATGFERQPPSMGELLGQVRAPAVIAPPGADDVLKRVDRLIKAKNLSDDEVRVLENLSERELNLILKLAGQALGARKRGPQAAPVEVQIQLNDRYEELKRKKGREYSQEIFMMREGHKIWACDVKTFERYRRNVKRLREQGLI